MSGADLFVVCKSCGSEVSPYITECPYCGNRLRKRAPKLDREGQPRRPRRARSSAPKLGRLRPGEMPGIRFDVRPYATLALVVASLVVSILTRLNGVEAGELAVAGSLDGEWWRPFTAPFVYGSADGSSGYQFAALVAVALFGWLLERRHGAWAPVLVFLVGGAAGFLLALLVDPNVIAAGGNAGALALLGAWAVPDVQARAERRETESDLLGVAAIAAVLLLMSLAVDIADPIAGAGGAVAGMILGLLLGRFGRER